MDQDSTDSQTFSRFSTFFWAALLCMSQKSSRHLGKLTLYTECALFYTICLFSLLPLPQCLD